MPSDASGNFSLVPGYLAVTGQPIEATQHNPPLEDIAAGLTQRVMASGAKPMTGPLLLADGAITEPGLVFNSAQGVGWYKTTNGWGFAVGGVLVVEITSAGIAKGARYIGELIPWTGLSAPSLCVLPFGQNLLRADYPDLWTFAQAEIAASSLFYTSGDGSTTFGIGDLRGRAIAGKDNMGGSAAGRLGNGSFFGSAARQVGGTGGEEAHTLLIGEITQHSHGSGTFAVSVDTPNYFSEPIADGAEATRTYSNAKTTESHAVAGTSGAAGGSAAHYNVQPTMIVNFALFAGA